MTKGLQRETAGRGSLALYTSVCPREFSFSRRTTVPIVLFIIGCLRHYARVHHLPYHATCTLYGWNSYHHELGDLYNCTTNSSSALGGAYSNTVDKEKSCNQARHRTHSLTALCTFSITEWKGLDIVTVMNDICALQYVICISALRAAKTATRDLPSARHRTGKPSSPVILSLPLRSRWRLVEICAAARECDMLKNTNSKPHGVQLVGVAASLGPRITRVAGQV